LPLVSIAAQHVTFSPRTALFAGAKRLIRFPASPACD
jgi:hypothetical protein